MKKIIVIIVLLVNFATGLLYADPPGRIKANYDRQNEMLYAQVWHPTVKPKYHLINRIVVKRNGNDFVRVTFEEQANRRKQLMEFEIPEEKRGIIKPGDILNITAYCSLAGKLDTTITIR